MVLDPDTRGSAEPVQEAARVARELRRLEALAGKRQFRIWLRRGLRGGLGAGATLLALVKLKVAASLSIKLALAGIVGLGLVFPPLFLALLAVAGIVIALVTCEGDCDCPSDCEWRERRRSRLDHLIAQRREWLATRRGPAPSPRRDAPGRRAGGRARPA